MQEQARAEIIEYKQVFVQQLEALGWVRDPNYRLDKHYFAWILIEDAGNNIAEEPPSMKIYCPCSVNDFSDVFHLSIFNRDREFVWTYPSELPWFSRFSHPRDETPEGLGFTHYQHRDDWEAAWRQFLVETTMSFIKDHLR